MKFKNIKYVIIVIILIILNLSGLYLIKYNCNPDNMNKHCGVVKKQNIVANDSHTDFYLFVEFDDLPSEALSTSSTDYYRHNVGDKYCMYQFKKPALAVFLTISAAFALILDVVLVACVIVYIFSRFD